jgi:hypothetical protein
MAFAAGTGKIVVQNEMTSAAARRSLADHVISSDGTEQDSAGRSLVESAPLPDFWR